MNMFKKVASEARQMLVEDGRPEVVTAEMVHREIKGNMDTVLEEARSILASYHETDEMREGKRLCDAGFHRTPKANKYTEQYYATQHARHRVELSEKHALKYPGLKFIAGEVMQSVCKKYGLVIGEVSRYMGDVPAWAMDAIEKSGVAITQWGYHTYGERSGRPSFTSSDPNTEEQANKDVEAHNALGLTYTVSYGHGHSEERKSVANIHRENLLLIAAPQKEMHVGYGERVEGAQIIQEDPIVSISVEGGYIVLAAWGEEGKDPQVFNAEQN